MNIPRYYARDAKDKAMKCLELEGLKVGDVVKVKCTGTYIGILPQGGAWQTGVVQSIEPSYGKVPFGVKIEGYKSNNKTGLFWMSKDRLLRNSPVLEKVDCLKDWQKEMLFRVWSQFSGEERTMTIIDEMENIGGRCNGKTVKLIFDTLTKEQKTLVYALVGYAATRSSSAKIDHVIFNPPATIVFWTDGTKTVAKCTEKDIFSKETGLFICMAKKAFGKNYVGKAIRMYDNQEVENE